jgi:hypothetical protein
MKPLGFRKAKELLDSAVTFSRGTLLSGVCVWCAILSSSILCSYFLREIKLHFCQYFYDAFFAKVCKMNASWMGYPCLYSADADQVVM